MLTKIVIGFVGIILLGILYVFIKEISNPAEGYEDDTGFHYGKEPIKKD